MPAPMRIVVKVGSAVVAPRGVLNTGTLARLAREIGDARGTGHRVVLVSSGAVACGFGDLGLDAMPRGIVERQASAAVGQPRLVRAWGEAFGGTPVAQVLVTSDDMEDRARFLNARHTIEALLGRGIVPIVNENDSVSFDEIKVGDNDRLSALVASLVDADLLVLLSAAPGVTDERGGVIERFDRAADALAFVRDEQTATGVGGMRTKVEAAEIASASGITSVVAPGDEPGVVGRVIEGESVGTRFEAGERGSALRKRWIGQAAKTRGVLIVDEGAARALAERGASLLPKGVVLVEGVFGIGDAVEVRDESQRAVARGLASYASDEITRIMGRRSDEIETVLGYAYSDEVVHRDDMVLVAGSGRG